VQQEHDHADTAATEKPRPAVDRRRLVYKGQARCGVLVHERRRQHGGRSDKSDRNAIDDHPLERHEYQSPSAPVHDARGYQREALPFERIGPPGPRAAAQQPEQFLDAPVELVVCLGCRPRIRAH
jgi:hypothetical protein